MKKNIAGKHLWAEGCPMEWADVRKKYNNEWIIVGAINARTQDDNRIIEQLTVADTFNNGNNGALHKYVELHEIILKESNGLEQGPKKHP